MSKEPRTPDDGRNERQRQRDEEQRDDRHRFARESDDPKERDRLLKEKPSDFIERTRPEDPTGERRQLTRDNVNPNIPSAEPGTGGIVDPKSLGMEGQAGVKPPDQPPDHPFPQQVAGREGELPEGFVPPRQHSINEPPGSNVLPGEGGPVQIPDDPKHDLPPLVLTSIDPVSIVVGSAPDFVLTVTGSGFGPNSVIVFDDEEFETTGDQTTLTASIPVAAAPAVVDVEVARGEELSDVLSFEFTAVAGDALSRKVPERKAKKDTPSSKRAKKGKR